MDNIQIGEIYTYLKDNRKVVVIQYCSGTGRYEVSASIRNRVNGFWVYPSQLKQFKGVVDRPRSRSKARQAGEVVLKLL